MKLRVLHCIHSLSGGGAERQLTLLANHSKNSDLEFGIFYVDGMNHNIEGSACELYTLTDPKNYPWRLVKEISAAIERFKPDIVHCWLPASVIVPGLIAAKLYKLPTISSYRNARDFGTWKDVIEYILSMFFANAIVSNNYPQQSNVFFRQLYRAKIHDHIPNAVAVPIEYRHEMLGREKNELFTILFVGRLVDAKNWQLLLEAVSKLDVKMPWQLQICGKGEDAKVYSAIDRLKLNNNVKMLGYRQDVYSIMAKADLLVLPSWYEGMPNVVLEAMSIGLPCVLSRIAAHTELLRNEPVTVYFDPSSAEQLTIILNDFIDGAVDVEQLSRSSINFADKFHPNILMKQYSAFYNNVLNEFNE